MILLVKNPWHKSPDLGGKQHGECFERIQQDNWRIFGKPMWNICQELQEINVVFWKTKAIQAKAHCEDNPSTTSFKDGCLKMIKLSKVIHVHNFGVWNFWKWHVLVVPSIQDYNETCYVSCWKLDFSLQM